LGHVTGYYGEKFLCAAYIFQFGQLLYWHLVQPLIILLISTDDYRCSESDQFVIFIFAVWYEIAFPLAGQIIFIGMLWLMSRVQKETRDTID
jgi:hypothetical protein